MPAYKAPLREFRYVLHEVLGATGHYRALGRDDINAELIEGVLEGAARFAEDVVAPTNEAGDRIGVRRLEDGRVVTPPGFAAAYRQYVDDGWAALCGPVEAGGQGLPESIGGVVGEMFVSANMSWKLYSGLTDSAVLCLDKRGTAEMRRIYLPKLVSGVWSGTMVLTEPHAGTDLGLMRTRAEPDGPDGLPHQRHQDLHHERRARPDREHHPPGPRQAPGRARGLARHQHVPGAEVPA